MSDLIVNGPIAYRSFRLARVCEAHEGHTHNYDHATIVIRGRLKVRYRYERDGQLIEGESQEFGQGDVVTIKAGVYHTLKALEPNTLYHCVFSHRDFDGLVSQTYVGHDEAYV